MTELADAVWRFLPARPDRRRVTTPDVIAANLAVSVAAVGEALMTLERTGRIVRDGKTRHGWHRVTPAGPKLAAVEPDQLSLFGGTA